MSISDSTRQLVIQAANYRCEYCKTSARLTGMPLIMEHILPRSLGGTDDRHNLAASCYRCNEFKGAKTEALDPETQQLVPLYNPRHQDWFAHFSWGNGGTHIIGITPIAKATVIALRLNNDNIVAARSIWLEFAWHPPGDN
jgi:5-methylcytosine-specific restriction endonuclease McrA